MEPEPEGELESWWDGLDRIESKLDHLHDDLVAMREWMRIPRPACYPLEVHDEGRAERGQEE